MEFSSTRWSNISGVPETACQPNWASLAECTHLGGARRSMPPFTCSLCSAERRNLRSLLGDNTGTVQFWNEQEGSPSIGAVGLRPPAYVGRRLRFSSHGLDQSRAIFR